jgi:hypothetical protein
MTKNVRSQPISYSYIFNTSQNAYNIWWPPNRQQARALPLARVLGKPPAFYLACTEGTVWYRCHSQNSTTQSGQQSKLLSLGTLQATITMLHASFIMRSSMQCPVHFCLDFYHDLLMVYRRDLASFGEVSFQTSLLR